MLDELLRWAETATAEELRRKVRELAEAADLLIENSTEVPAGDDYVYTAVRPDDVDALEDALRAPDGGERGGGDCLGKRVRGL